jgi:hypothetical protein
VIMDVKLYVCLGMCFTSICVLDDKLTRAILAINVKRKCLYHIVTKDNVL